MKPTALLLIAIAAFSAACDDVAAPTDGIILLDFPANADTVIAIVQQPIQLILLDSRGRPLSGTWVELRNAIDQVGNETSPGPKVYATSGTLYPTLDGAGSRTGEPRIRTDSRGRATAYLRVGHRAGVGYIKAVAGEYRDSVAFQTLPGAGVALTALPADTSVLVGADYPLTVFEIDRWENLLPEPASGVTVVSSEPDVAILDGSTVIPLSVGRASFDLSGQALSGRVHVSVVPAVALATGTVTYPHVPVVAPSLVTTDGSPADPIEGVDGSCPAWHPDGNRLLFDGLRLVTPAGAQSQVPTGNPDLIAGCGRFSADGEWIYFDGRLSTDTVIASQVWRVRSDGTDLEQITDQATGSHAWSASPSPDGSRIVFVAGNPHWGGHLIVHTLASGAQDTIKRDVLRARAAWSPTGEWIAYTHFMGDTEFEHEGRTLFYNDRVALVQLDGTDHPVVAGAAGPMVFDGGGVNWSPDGEWLVAMSAYRDLRIKLIHVANGQTIPLNGSTRGHFQPAWRP